jgi:hemerythrin
LQRLELTDDLLTGNAEIDRQHGELYAWGNRILFPGDSQEESQAFRHGLRFLARYAREHFAAEEAAMRAATLPGLEQHQAQHRRFRDELEQLRAQARRDGSSRPLQLRLHFLLSDWFVQHLRYWDRKLATALQEEGQATAVSAVRLRPGP